MIARSALSSEFLADGSVARPSDPLADDSAVRANVDTAFYSALFAAGFPSIKTIADQIADGHR